MRCIYIDLSPIWVLHVGFSWQRSKPCGSIFAVKLCIFFWDFVNFFLLYLVSGYFFSLHRNGEFANWMNIYESVFLFSLIFLFLFDLFFSSNGKCVATNNLNLVNDAVFEQCCKLPSLVFVQYFTYGFIIEFVGASCVHDNIWACCELFMFLRFFNLRLIEINSNNFICKGSTKCE